MDYVNPSIGDILLIALVGFVTVFVVLIALMGIIKLISLFGAEKKAAAPEINEEPVSAPTERVDTYTGVKLNGVDDKTAAILMAIVANKLDKPLDNLRFISIKEVK